MRLARSALALVSILAGTMAFGLPAAARADTDIQPGAWGLHYAYGNDAHDVGVRARWLLSLLRTVPGQPELFAEGGLDYWHGERGASGNQSLVDASAVVGLRWRLVEAWFVDGSFGPHVLSETHLGHRGFGIALQFCSRLAIGAGFGESRRHEIGAFVAHLSNASLAQPNNGMTFFGLEYRYAVR